MLNMLHTDLEAIINGSRASQNKQELAFLLGTLLPFNPKVILEIGAWRGWSVEVWYKVFQPEWIMGVENDRTVIDPELMDRYPFMIRNSHEVETFQAIEDSLEGKKVDFLFIDGDHTYDGVKRDFQLYSELVKQGGVIALHDIALNEQKWVDAGVEVCKFWAELKQEFETKEIVGDQGTGTGIIFV